MMHSSNPLDAIFDDMSPVSNVGEKVGYGYAYSRGRGYCGVARMNGRAGGVHLQLCGRSTKKLGEQRRSNSANRQELKEEPF